MILEENKRLLERYRFICRGKGMTNMSIEAICDYDLKVYLRWLGEKDALSVTHLDIQDFLMYCSVVRGNKDKALNRKHTNLNMFYKRLIINMDLEIKNPLDKIDKPKLRKKVKPYLKESEYNQMIEYLEYEEDLRGLALIALLFSSGCRLSEVQQLKINSLDHISRRFIVLGKGQKERECMFSVDASNRIKEYIRNRRDNNKSLFVAKHGGKTLTTKGIQDFLRQLGRRAGIEQNVHPHLFRHGRAMQLLKAGASLETIQRVLGHESIATTQIYAHMNFDSVQTAVDAIDNRIIENEEVAKEAA